MATTSEDARQRGNAFYKQGKLKDAEAAYKKAAELAPEDPAPLSNLSSVQFELGNYAAAATLVRQSLKLTKDGTKDGAGDEATGRKEKTLYARLAKCYMHDSDWERAAEVVDLAGDEELKASLRATSTAAEAWKRSVSLKDHIRLVFDRTPRYKAQLEDVPEYFPIGHDRSESLFDKSLMASSSARTSLSFMLCGSGDARHLFYTLLTMGAQELTTRTPKDAWDVGRSMAYLSPRLKVEVLVGEMSDTLERIRYKCLGSRSKPAGDIDPSGFPTTYDRIHMSNVPDYVGGPLTVALHGRPLLREDRESSLQYTVLVNPPRFKTREHFRAEYMLMYDDKRVAEHFCLAQPAGPARALPDDKVLASLGMTRFSTEGCQVWDRQPPRKLPLPRRLPRGAFERWLYAHFLKICLPYRRPPYEPAPVYAPLNLTAFLRLVVHLAEIGYPAHWFSTVLSALCAEGDITTTARPPRKLVTDEAFVDRVFPAAAMTVAPWRAGFTTLLSLWSRLLPFGLAAPPRALVSPADVAEYSVTFPGILDSYQYRVPHFVLLFWDASAAGKPPSDMRPFLLDDETGDTSASARKTKRTGVHVVDTFCYVTETRTASFWLRTDVVQTMAEGGWDVFIWRTDTWERATPGVRVKDNVTWKRLWTE